jgi:phage repressor protein C with HTH and peptisase S24 domain
MIVSGDSMSPEHKAGSIALVNPHLPARVGDSCIFRSHADDGTNLAMIKEYRGQTETHWKVRQHTPPKDFQLKKSEWQIVHRTVGNYFP